MPPSPPASPQDREKSRDFSQLLSMLHYLKPYRWRAVGAGIALLIASGTVLGLGAGLRYLVDQGFGAGDATLLDQALVILLGVVALLAVATYCRFYLVSWIGERVVADIRRDVFDHVITLDPGFFEQVRTAEILSRLTTDTAIVQVVVGTSVSVALRNTLLLIGGSAMLMITSLKLTLLVFLVVPLVLIPILTFGRRVRGLSRSSQDRVADLGIYIDESLSAIRTVQAFTHEAEDRRDFGAHVERAFDVARSRIKARAMLTAIVMLLIFGAISVIFWIGGHDMLAGRLSGGDLTAFVFYAAVVAGSVGAISEVIGDLQRAAGASERLLELLRTRPAIAPPARPLALPSPAQGAVRFENVTFHYPTRPDRSALESLTLTIEPGQSVALVGPSGAGKTTLFQLLLRFYDPEQGVIRFDGVDLRELDPQDLRRRIGLVAQDPVVFAGSVRDNIRYGKPDASEDEIRAAAEAAYATEFIDLLPARFDTELGERGVRLSGGQRQRIAIARAILRDPVLLLLDEATSALDAESERAVQRALERLMIGRTSLVIAHRLATVISADRIVVIDQGQIIAEGTHAQLMRENGLYARLAQMQFSDHPGDMPAVEAV